MNKSLNRVQSALQRLVRNQAYGSATNALKKTHTADLAGLFPYFQAGEQKWFAGAVLKAGKLPGVLTELDEALVPQFLALIPETKLVDAIREMDPDDVADFLNSLPEDRRQPLFSKLTGGQKLAVGKLLGYEPDTAGGIMTTEFVSLSETLTVSEAVERLRKLGNVEDMFYVYVVDSSDQLIGTVSFRELVFAKEDKTLGEIMLADPVVVRPHANQELVAEMIARYNLLAIPVVDENHRLVGRVTVDDAIDVLREEATEDIYHLANLGQEDHALTSMTTSSRRRIPWLFINLGTALLAAATVAAFSETISQFVILAALLPIVGNMGGNSGIQTLTVVVRSLALGEIDWSIGAKVIMKEIGVGLLNGLAMGLVVGIIAGLWYGNATLGFVLFLAMIMTLIITGLFGALVPLTLRKLKLDPALGSSIFVTTAADVGGFFLLLSLSTFFIEQIAQ